MSNGEADIGQEILKALKEWLKGVAGRLSTDLKRHAEGISADIARYASMVASGETRRAAAHLRHLKAQSRGLSMIIYIRERRRIVALWEQTVTMLARFAAQMLIKLLAAV